MALLVFLAQGHHVVLPSIEYQLWLPCGCSPASIARGQHLLLQQRPHGCARKFLTHRQSPLAQGLYDQLNHGCPHPVISESWMTPPLPATARDARSRSPESRGQGQQARMRVDVTIGRGDVGRARPPLASLAEAMAQFASWRCWGSRA